MDNFKCRVCGSTTFDEILGGLFKCSGCSVLFGDPPKFSSTTEPVVITESGRISKLSSKDRVEFVDSNVSTIVEYTQK